MLQNLPELYYHLLDLVKDAEQGIGPALEAGCSDAPFEQPCVHTMIALASQARQLRKVTAAAELLLPPKEAGEVLRRATEIEAKLRKEYDAAATRMGAGSDDSLLSAILSAASVAQS